MITIRPKIIIDQTIFFLRNKCKKRGNEPIINNVAMNNDLAPIM